MQARRHTWPGGPSVRAGAAVGLRTAMGLCFCLLIGAWHNIALAQEQVGGLFVMRPDGSEVRRLVTVEGQTDYGSPRWSHDGRRVVFQARRGTGPRSCYVVNSDGSGLQELAQGRVPDLSPDGKQLVFQANSASPIFVQNVENEGRTQIAMGYSPRWGPEGEMLAISDRRQLLVQNLLSGEEAGLFERQHAEVFDGFDWSPDGKQLAVVTRPVEGGQRELLLVDADGKSSRSLATGEMGGFVSFSPDGKQLLYSDDWKLQVIDVAGPTKPRLVPGQKGKNRHPDWSPDGKWIVFASTRDDIE